MVGGLKTFGRTKKLIAEEAEGTMTTNYLTMFKVI